MYINIHIRVYSMIINNFFLGLNYSRGTKVAEFWRRQTISNHGTDTLCSINGPLSSTRKDVINLRISVSEMMEMRLSGFPSIGSRPNGTTIVYTVMELPSLRRVGSLHSRPVPLQPGSNLCWEPVMSDKMRSSYITCNSEPEREPKCARTHLAKYHI